MANLHGTMNSGGLLHALFYELKLAEKKVDPVDSVGYHILSNGPTWSLDGKSFYFTCSKHNQIKKFDYDTQTGKITNPQ